jgi:hypothetical protein
MSMKPLLAAFVMFASVASAADVSGVWSGAFRVTDGEHDVPQLFTFKQAGSRISGTGGPDSSEQYPVLHGQLANSHLKFEVKSTLRDFVYDLKETNNELRGTVLITGGDAPVTAEVWLRPVH